MLHRVSKKQDPNKGKWIGVGGKQEEGETIFECARRETLEETGLTLLDLSYRGIVTFINTKYPSEEMHLFTATRFTGEIKPCPEGVLKWVDETEILSLNLWQGDRVFIDLLIKNSPFFRLTLNYDGDELIKYEISC